MIRVRIAIVAASVLAGCAFSPRGEPSSKGGQGGIIIGVGGQGGSVGQGPCQGLQCQQSTCKMGNCVQQPCSGGAVTRLTGTVYDPAGKVPLPNVDVFVPNTALADYTDGPACDTCAMALSGAPVVRVKTDTAGHFTLGDGKADVPVGSGIPLVVQVGRWRRQVTVDVPACVDTAVATDATRLPRNQSEGHLPKIALTTGGADALECLLRKIGISDSEFTPESGSGRVNFFAGVNGSNKFNATLGGASFTPVAPWWDDVNNLRKYDMILHSCEGTETPTNKSMAARMALQQYADAGGRVFASHWHNYWFEHGPTPWPTTPATGDLRPGRRREFSKEQRRPQQRSLYRQRERAPKAPQCVPGHCRARPGPAISIHSAAGPRSPIARRSGGIDLRCPGAARQW
jgi:hypothetical protein